MGRQVSATKLVGMLSAMLALGVGAALLAVLGVTPGGDAIVTADVGRNDDALSEETASDEVESRRPAKTSSGGADAASAASLRGAVRLYRTREPVSGLTLTLIVPEELRKTDEEPLAATTGEDGVFRFTGLHAAAGYELRGLREPYAAIDMTGIDVAPSEERDLGTLWLEVPVDLQVRVLTLQGKPIDGAEVAVFATGEQDANQKTWTPDHQLRRVLALTSSPRPTSTAATDEEGAALVTGLLPGRYHVRATAPGHAAASGASVLLAPDAAPSPVRILLGKGHGLGGSVRDVEGELIAAAEVIAAPSASRRPGLDRSAAETDDEGVYRLAGLATGQYTLYLQRKDMPLVQVGNVGIPLSDRYDIRLRPTASVVGTVTDPDGAPVAGADVGCSPQNGLPVTAKTDESGAFEMNDVQAGPLSWFRVSAKGFVPHPDPSAPQQGAGGESLREGAVMQRDVELSRGATLVATVKADSDGAPIEGATVQLMIAQMWGGGATPWNGKTDAEGVAQVTGLVPGEYLAVVSAPNYVQEGMPRYYQNLVRSPQAMPDAWRVEISPGAEETRVEYRLTAGATVSGKVTDKDGAAVAGARVTVSGAKGEIPVFSDAEGRFLADAVAPSLRATASATAPGQPSATSEPFIVEPGAEVKDIEIEMKPGGSVTGIVRTSDGAPLDGAVVRYVAGELSERNTWSFRQFDGKERYPVSEDGRFEITGVKPGKITVRADAEGYLPAWDAKVVVTAEQQVGGIDLIISRDTEISGRVEGPAGAPVAGATVYANYRGMGQSRVWGFVAGLSGQPSGQTDAQGLFTLRGLKQGNYSMSARAPGYTGSSTANTATGAGDVLITLKEGMSISGVVRDEAGKPMAGVPVRAKKADNRTRGQNQWWWGNAGSVNTGPDGTFELKDLAEGAYDLTVSTQWWWGRDANVQDTTLAGVTTGRDDVEIIVQKGHTIDGLVLDDDDEPVRVAWVSSQFQAGSGGARGQTQKWSRVNPDGTFHISGLQPGTYTLQTFGSFQSEQRKGVSSGSVDVELRVRRGLTIRGVVTDEKGLSISRGVSMQLRSVGTDKWNGRQTVMPGDGTFTILGLEEGAYDLRVRSNGFAPLLVPKVAAGETGLDLVLVTGVEIKGYVVGANGAPLGNVSVQASQIGVPAGAVAATSSARTGDDGTFTLKGLTQTDFRLIVRRSKLAPAIVQPVPGGTEGLKVVLAEGTTISGKTLDADGQPVAGVRLQLRTDDSVTIAWATSKSDGAFEFQYVPDGGSWKVSGSSWTSGRRLNVRHDEPVESGASDLELKLD